MQQIVATLWLLWALTSSAHLPSRLFTEWTNLNSAGTVVSSETHSSFDGLRAWSVAYDALGRLLGVTNGYSTGTSNRATYAYDEVGNLANQVDALGRHTRYEYDAMGRRVRTVLPQNQAEVFAYNAAGNLTRHTNFNGVIITNQYDSLDRLTSRTSASGYSVSFTYSATGKRTSMTDASGVTTNTYDSRDRQATQSSSQGTLTYAYDIFGNLQSLTSSRSGGAAIAYGYDTLNRLTSASGNSASANYGFDGVGNVETVRLGNSVTNTYSYSSLNRLTNIATRTSSGTLASFFYQLAAAGNRTNLAENINGTTRSHAWAYDALYRLTNEVVSGTAPTGSNRYRYDAVGNRTNRTTTFTGIAALTNQSFTFSGNDLLANDAYDSNGNTRTNAANTYAYDVENRLTNYNSGAASYIYNGDGWLVRKTIGTTTTLYLVDDRNPTGYAQTIEEATVSSGVTNLAVVYLSGLDLVSQSRSGTVSYYGYDGTGNTRYLTGSGATVTDTYLYDAFGVLLASSGGTVNEFRYSGERLIPETGLTYLRARYLNNGTGRFWTRDRLEGLPQDPISLHRYLYVADNPINMVDPSGYNGDVISFNVSGALAATLAAFTAAAIVEVKTRAFGTLLVASFESFRDAIGTHPEHIYYNKRQTEAVVSGLIATATAHVEKLEGLGSGGSDPNDPRNHWKNEIKAALERAKRLIEKRLTGDKQEELLKKVKELAEKSEVLLE